MRLSEIKGERVFDVIADIIEPACNIMQDKDAAAIFDHTEKQPDDMTTSEYVISKVKRSMPKLMRTHKDDLITILATVNGIDKDEYRDNLTMPKLIQGVYEILTDEDLLGFLS